MSDAHGARGGHGPSGPDSLEDRLRAALGDSCGAGVAPGAKARVLTGIRHRRLRRLQVAGVAAVVAIGLAAGLPQVFGGSAPSPGSAGGAFAARAPQSPGSATTSSRPSATCEVGGGAATVCGDLATGSGAQSLTATAASQASLPTSFGNQHANAPLGHPLLVRSGTPVVVDLPRVKSRWQWNTPAIAGTPVYHGSGPPVVVVGIGTQGTAQAFMVTTRVPVTVVLEARDDVPEEKKGGEVPMVVPGSAPVWALELKVEGP